MLKNKDIKTLYLDFDNTIGNTPKCVVDLYNEDFATHKGFHYIEWTDINSWDFTECNCASVEQIHGYFTDPRFFERVEFMYYAKEVIEWLSQFYKIKIPSMGVKENLDLKTKWFNENLPEVKFIGVDEKIYSDKSHIDMSDGILLDDDYRNLRTSNAIEAICFGDEYKWNEKWMGTRCYSWLDFGEYMTGERLEV